MAERDYQPRTTLPYNYMAVWYEIPAEMLEFADAIIYALVDLVNKDCCLLK